jgi:hypothetical protein
MFRTERLTVKVSPPHRAAIEQIAQADGESIAAAVRHLIRAEAQRRGLWVVTPEQANGTVRDVQ